MNKHRPHIMVLPEDDANRQIANGFVLDPCLDDRTIQILPSAGGWPKVRDAFEKTHRLQMERNQQRYMVLLVDFDRTHRLQDMRRVVPATLADRVFIVGAWSEPEELRSAGLGTFEGIGTKLAVDCREQSKMVWNHELLKHNATEVARMTALLRPILFPS